MAQAGLPVRLDP